jgi:hypothetical protein
MIFNFSENMQCGDYTISNAIGRGWLKTKPEGSYKVTLSPALLHLLFVWDVIHEAVWNYLFDSGSDCVLCARLMLHVEMCYEIDQWL